MSQEAFPSFNPGRTIAKNQWEATRNTSQYGTMKTNHDVAVAYAAKGWSGHASRQDRESSIRYKGAFTL